ncbi:MAG TPA: hypothetical protein VGN42_24425 [Pirellulales bacterium]|nr:hypothetical protein [Pirellulales bacterium]
MSARGRFILIDHSLCDFSGHHYEYARAVLDAATADGRPAVLVTNRKFASEVASDWPIHRSYKYGIWFHQGAPAWQIALWRAWKAVRRGAECRFSLREKASFRGAKSDIGLGEDSEMRLRKLGFARANFEAGRRRQFIRDTQRVLRQLAVTSDDLVFLPTLSCGDFAALRRLAQSGGRASCPHWHVLFRHPLCRLSLRERACFRGAKDDLGACRFWTDSEELTAEYRRATGCAFGTLPIPHAASSGNPARKPPPLRILYLGDARLEKGFHHLPGIVRSLTDGDSERRQFEFYIQAHSTSAREAPEIKSARAELARLADRGVALFNSALTPAQYRELLASGHLVVLPYDARAYAARSSGLFAEALAAGIPTVVPAETWMAQWSPQGAGQTYRDIRDIAAIILAIAADYPSFARSARSAAEDWRQRHNAGRLVSLLRETSREPDAEAPSRSVVDLSPSIA